MLVGVSSTQRRWEDISSIFSSSSSSSSGSGSGGSRLGRKVNKLKSENQKLKAKVSVVWCSVV